MAGPTIAVRFLGDLKGLGTSIQNAGKTAEGVGSKLRGTFSSVLSTLNRTGVLGPFGESLNIVNEGLDQMGEHAKSVGDKLMAIGGIAVGVGVGLSALGSKEQQAHNQLSAAIEATGKSYEDYGKQIEEAIKHNEKFGQSSASTQQALQVLTQATHDPAKALQLLGTATDLAAAKHTSLVDAAGSLGKVYNGNTKLLKAYGIVIDKSTGKTADGQTATQALANVLKGQAAASVDTFNGRLKVMGTIIEDHVAQFGQRYGPAITSAGAAMTVLGGAVRGTQAVVAAFTTTQEAATAATEATTVAEEGATAAGIGMMATMGLIVLAVLALVAVGYVIYRNWNTIWTAIKAVVMSVFNWVKANWPLLLGILIGPIGLAVVLIVKYWTTIKNAAVAAFNWVKTNWPLILAILTGPIGVAVLVISRNWQAIKDGAGAAVQWVKDRWNDLVSFFSGLPGRIGSAVSGMFDGIWQAFRSSINRIIRGWNSLHFGIPSIDTHIPGIGKVGGGSFGVPQIPYLAAGGLLTSDGLIYAHAGEVVAPIEKVMRSGPLVSIASANFSQEADIDLLMSRVAWLARTRAV